jgi:hypothetical protein
MPPTLDAGKILRDLADRLEARGEGSFVWRALAAEIRAAVAHAEREDFLKPLAIAAKQTIAARFDESKLFTDEALDAIQRIANQQRIDRNALQLGVTTIALDVLDGLIDGYRHLHGQLIGARQKIKFLEEALLAERNTRVEPLKPFDRFDDQSRCLGNCSRGGDGPPCGKRGCQG